MASIGIWCFPEVGSFHPHYWKKVLMLHPTDGIDESPKKSNHNHQNFKKKTEVVPTYLTCQSWLLPHTPSFCIKINLSSSFTPQNFPQQAICLGLRRVNSPHHSHCFAGCLPMPSFNINGLHECFVCFLTTKKRMMQTSHVRIHHDKSRSDGKCFIRKIE